MHRTGEFSLILALAVLAVAYRLLFRAARRLAVPATL